ncbi:fimbrial protein [Aeromonas salmonicida]|uniref:fimbrial protein n=1 Tax=Aeromonas salmonicida TaxID=645 RepID=UPI0027969E14|nr:fimbrial protein [Aeromonas salmonicida]MDQ1884172.1 fimbrial protein [Aeromonas salmonicida]
MDRQSSMLFFVIGFSFLFFSFDSAASDNWKAYFDSCRDNRTQPSLNLNFGNIKVISTSSITSPREIGRVSATVPLFSDCPKLFYFNKTYGMTGYPEYTPGINARTLDIGIPGLTAVMTYAGEDNSNPYEHILIGDYSKPTRGISQPAPVEGALGLIIYQIGPIAAGLYTINAKHNANIILDKFIETHVKYGAATPIGTIEVSAASCEFDQPNKTISFGKVAWGNDTIESDKVNFSLGFHCTHDSLPGTITFSANDGSSHDNIYLSDSAVMAKNVAIRLYDENGRAIKINSQNKIKLDSGQNEIVLKANLVKLSGDVVPGKVDAVATVNVTYQ